jgi:hypothetical protein
VWAIWVQLISKTSADKERIMLALGQNFMFKTLEPALCDAIVNAMEAYNVSAGTEVIKQVCACCDPPLQSDPLELFAPFAWNSGQCFKGGFDTGALMESRLVG